MRAPLSWIRDFTPADAPVDDLVAALNQLGLEVEAIEEPGREIGGVRAARILEVLPHPDADRLQLAEVDFGEGTTRVVCGAPNIAAGQVVPFAPAGARLPGGVTLERRSIRGQVSDGMLCSPQELGLGDDHSGILELDADVELGTDVRELLGLDDVVFDLAITPNRPDAMCIVGVARELAAHFGAPLTVPTPEAVGDPGVASDVSVVIEDPERCPRYLGWVARVTMGASPPWLAQRLIKAGMRPISNVVDVTNYVLLERNQPLHAFDLTRLAGRGIVVRLADAGERMTTLDGVERALDPADLLICDAARAPQAIAGIMGGATSEVSDATTEILLESAYFERMGIARTSKRLKLRSEASARFERGIDPDGVATHAARAMELLSQVADARVGGDAVDEYPRPHTRPTIVLRTSRVNRILGTELADREVIGALRPLEIDVEGGGDEISAVPPSFRPDLEREIDLVEEVARRVGFDSIGRTVPKPAEQIGALSVSQRERRIIADALVGAGASEAMTIPLLAPELLARFAIDDGVALTNPLRADESMLRTAVAPGLLRAVALNVARGNPDLVLFELGTAFGVPADGALLPEEHEHVAVVVTGTVRRAPVEPDRPVDAHDAVDLLMVVVDALALRDVHLEARDLPGWRAGAVAHVVAGGVPIGMVGELDPAVVAELELVAPVVAFEVRVDALLAASRRDRSFVAPSPFPTSSIDLAFVLPDAVSAGAVEQTIRDAVGGLLESIRAFDEFRREELGNDRRSVAFAVRFRAADRTLTDTEVAELRQGAIDAVTRAHAAVLRG
ncbi:MAG: phenylalanine--tRNA ligase subunit beta [Acidimicrobiia bacterium]